MSPLHEADAVVRLAQRAEAAGFPSFGSAEGWTHDAFVLLAQVAAATCHIQIGTGVISVWSRSPAAIAMAAVGLQTLSGGRFTLGLGASSKPLAEGLHGVTWEDPIGRLRSTTEAVRSLLAGGRAEVGPGSSRPLKLGSLPAAPVPIMLAALADPSIRLAGEIADCWLPFLWARSRLDRGRDLVSEGEARAEEPVSTWIRPSIPVAIGSDAEASREMAAMWLLLYLTQMGPFYRTLLRERLGFREEVDAFLEANAKAGAPVLPAAAERLAEEVTLMGVHSEAWPRIEQWLEAGADGVNLVLPPWLVEEELFEVVDATAPQGKAAAVGTH